MRGRIRVELIEEWPASMEPDSEGRDPGNPGPENLLDTSRGRTCVPVSLRPPSSAASMSRFDVRGDSSPEGVGEAGAVGAADGKRRREQPRRLCPWLPSLCCGRRSGERSEVKETLGGWQRVSKRASKRG
jgi:hypothetical protein